MSNGLGGDIASVELAGCDREICSILQVAEEQWLYPTGLQVVHTVLMLFVPGQLRLLTIETKWRR